MAKKNLILIVATFIVMMATLIFGIVEIKQISTMKNPCGGNGITILDSQGNETFISTATYVDRHVYAEEKAETEFGLEYTKEGVTNLLNIDCDVKEAFQILDCIRMQVKIKIGDVTHYRAYAKGSDGFTYLVETDEFGNILRDGEGNARIISRCDFADLYLGED